MTDFILKQKVQAWLIAILIVFNGVAVYLLLSGGPVPPPPEHKNMEPAEMLENRLGLTNEQGATLEKLRREHFETTAEIDREINDLKKYLLDEAFSENPDRKKAVETAEELGHLSSQMEMFIFDHFSKIRKNLSSEQADEFKRLLTSSMAPGRRPGDNPPPRRLPPPR